MRTPEQTENSAMCLRHNLEQAQGSKFRKSSLSAYFRKEMIQIFLYSFSTLHISPFGTIFKTLELQLSHYCFNDNLIINTAFVGIQ